jgi:hypothetical protein
MPFWIAITEKVAQHVRSHRPANVGAVGHALDQDLDGAGRHAQGVVQGEMPLKEGLDASRQGNDAPLGLGAIRTALAIDHEAVALPINVVFGELRQLRDSEAGIQERPDDELLRMRLAGVGQPRGFVLRQGFAFELIRHALIIRIAQEMRNL